MVFLNIIVVVVAIKINIIIIIMIIIIILITITINITLNRGKVLYINEREMICLQQFYNIFTTNPKWQVVTGCYCWVEKLISVSNSYLNQ